MIPFSLSLVSLEISGFVFVVSPSLSPLGITPLGFPFPIYSLPSLSIDDSGKIRASISPKTLMRTPRPRKKFGTPIAQKP